MSEIYRWYVMEGKVVMIDLTGKILFNNIIMLSTNY